MSPVLIKDEATGISETESRLEVRPKINAALHQERCEKLLENEPWIVTLAKLAGGGVIVIAVYLLMQILGQLPTPYPQEDLLEKDPLEVQQQVSDSSAANVVSGTSVIFNQKQ